MGRRIAAELAEAFQPARVLLLGLANEYVYYFCTPEEFDAQHYEGSCTLYGQAAGALLLHDLKAVAENSAVVVGPAIVHLPVQSLAGVVSTLQST